MKTVLVTEDDKDIAEAIKIYLEGAGYHAETAGNGQIALDRVKENPPDLIIMDVMMPIMDGIEATKKIREFSTVPIIMLSAKSEDIDKIHGLNIGSDDYISKPFNPMELIARVNAAVRRSDNFSEDNSELVCGALRMNLDTKEVFSYERPVKLTAREWSILKFFMENPGKVFNANEIYKNVWGEESFNTETVTVHIRRLREKIELNPKEPKFIVVVWGLGYKLEEGK